MAYGATGVDRRMRETTVAVQNLATDFFSVTAAGSATAQTATITRPFAKITTAVAGAQVPDATLTLTITLAGVTTSDVARVISMSLVSGTAAGFAPMSVVCTANTITIIIVNSGTANWASTPVFLVNLEVIKSLPATVAN